MATAGAGTWTPVVIAGMPTPGDIASTAAENAAELKYVIVNIMGVPDDGNYDQNPVVKTMDYMGIASFHDATGLYNFTNKSNIDNFKLSETHGTGAAATTVVKSTPLGWLRLIHSAIGFYHQCCRDVAGHAALSTLTPSRFALFRSTFDTSTDIIPWGNTLPPASMTAEEKLIIEWNKRLKLDKSSFKEFKDDAYWHRYKESFLDTVESMGLSHCLDSHFTVTHPRLDLSQRRFLYDIFSTKFTAPAAKAIVLQHKATKNTRDLWDALENHYSESMAGLIKVQELSTYLTSTRFNTCGWRGSKQNFLLNWQEKARLHDEISDDPYTDNQKINFLNVCLQGTPGLDQVLANHRSAVQSSGRRSRLHFSDYVGKLMVVASSQDAGNKITSNPRRTINEHQLVFENDPIATADEPMLETNYHDYDDPPQDLTVMRTEQRASYQKPLRSEKVRLSFAIWKGMSNDEQGHWDALTDKTKLAILKHGAQRALVNQDAGGSRPQRRRMVKTHETEVSGRVFEDDYPSDTSATIETNVHHVEPRKPRAVSFKDEQSTDLLALATGKQQANPGDINVLLSQSTPKPTLESSTHELTYERSDYTPSVYTHELMPVEKTHEAFIPTREVDYVPPPIDEATLVGLHKEKPLIDFDAPIQQVLNDVGYEKQFATGNHLLDVNNYFESDYLDHKEKSFDTTSTPSCGWFGTDDSPHPSILHPPKATGKSINDIFNEMKDDSDQKMSGKFSKVDKPIPFKDRLDQKLADAANSEVDSIVSELSLSTPSDSEDGDKKDEIQDPVIEIINPFDQLSVDSLPATFKVNVGMTQEDRISLPDLEETARA